MIVLSITTLTFNILKCLSASSSDNFQTSLDDIESVTLIASSSSSNVNLPATSEMSAGFDSATIPVPRRSFASMRRNSSKNEAVRSLSGSPKREHHSFDEYNGDEEAQTLSISNPLDNHEITGRRSSESSIHTETSQRPNNHLSSLAARFFAPFPAAKPVPPTAGTDQDFAFEEPNSEINDDQPVDELDANDLMSMIPKTFVITENSGKYHVYTDDPFLTSSEVMKKRSALYQLIAEVYLLFDTFDFDGFREFLTSTSDFKNHQDFRYHLIENLVQRFLRTDNSSTCDSLTRFIMMIDEVSVAKTVGKAQVDSFEAFKLRLRGLESVNKTFSEPIKQVISEYSANERKRLNPLTDLIKSNNYDGIKSMISQSRMEIYVSAKDFLQILDQPCSSARYIFMCWAIRSGNFNAHERTTDLQVTPLMIAAMYPRKSTDVIKAILLKAPSTITEVNLNGFGALKYAKTNRKLPKKYRSPTIAMLSLTDVANDSLNEAIRKYL